jgi:hypothetical protein
LFIGVAATAKPEAMSKKFGITVSGVALPYVMSTGIRDVFIGLIVLILFYLQDWTALGAGHLCIGIVAISDFLVVRKYGDKKTSLIHLGGAVVVFAYGAWLLAIIANAPNPAH